MQAIKNNDFGNFSEILEFRMKSFLSAVAVLTRTLLLAWSSVLCVTQLSVRRDKSDCKLNFLIILIERRTNDEKWNQINTAKSSQLE